MRIIILLNDIWDVKERSSTTAMANDFNKVFQSNVKHLFQISKIKPESVSVAMTFNDRSDRRKFSAEVLIIEVDKKSIDVIGRQPLEELASTVGYSFKEYVYSFIDNGAFINVHVNINGKTEASWLYHPRK